MVEKDLNRIIVKNIKQHGWAHKISDDAQSFTSTGYKPFDLFGLTPINIIFAESKLLKGYKAFSFDRIRDHQVENLTTIKRISSKSLFAEWVYTLIILGVWVIRKELSIYIFDINAITYLRDNLHKLSLLKKDLLLLKEREYYLPIQKEVFDVNRISEKLITCQTIQSLFQNER